MSNGIVTSFDLSIKSCVITGSSGQSLDFKDMVLEIDYFEDIFANGISGWMLISDSKNYINVLELHGSEVLTIELDKPGLELPIKQNFRIYTVTDRKQPTQTNETYIIRFYSEEMFLNEQYRVSTSFSKLVVSEMVYSIAKQYLKIPDSKISVEKTGGIRDIVVPNFRPIQAINWLSTFAMADGHKNIGSPFLFYEDRDGFKFRSLLELFKNPVYKTYEYSAKGLKDENNPSVIDLNRELVNVLQYEHVKNFDAVTAVRSGAFANKVHTIDPLRLKLGEKDFKYSEYIKQNVSQLNEFAIPTTAKNRFGDTLSDTPGVVRFCMTTTGQSENPYIKSKNLTINENRVEDTVPYRVAQISQLCNNRLKLLIPGDVYMTVGRVIQFNLPEIAYSSSTRKKKNDEYYSGKYLVTAVRHVLNQENKFFSCIEICKDSYPSQYGAFNNSDPMWKDLR